MYVSWTDETEMAEWRRRWYLDLDFNLFLNFIVSVLCLFGRGSDALLEEIGRKGAAGTARTAIELF